MGAGAYRGMQDLPIVAEGENARGEHWYLKAAGSPADYYTMLDTLHPDGRRDEGGMGGARSPSS